MLAKWKSPETGRGKLTLPDKGKSRLREEGESLVDSENQFLVDRTLGLRGGMMENENEEAGRSLEPEHENQIFSELL